MRVYLETTDRETGACVAFSEIGDEEADYVALVARFEDAQGYDVETVFDRTPVG